MQPSFVPAKAQWWITNWIQQTVDTLIDGLIDAGRAELNVDFCASIPVLTITGSFGIPFEQALDVRASVTDPDRVVEILTPIVAARTASPDEKPRLWEIMREIWPNYDEYQSRTDRQIPVVVLTPR